MTNTETASHPQPTTPSNDPITWITVAEAAALLKIKPATVISRIKKGTLEGKQSSEFPFTFDGKENYLVLLECLPQKAQYAYQISHLPQENLLSVDLASPRSTFGDVWISQFINIAQLIQEAALIRKKYHGTGKVTENLRNLSASYGISLSALYRFEGQPSVNKLSILYTDPVYLQNKLPSTMCLWSCDLAFALYLNQESYYSQNDIQAELSRKRETVLCATCPYHPDADRKGFDTDIPVCAKHDEYMLVPNNRRTINRLLKHIPSQLVLFCRRGYRE